jgi:predicted nucleotidyltransferase
MAGKIIESLREREKELNCLYKVHEILRDEESPLDVVFKKLVNEIPMGWQYAGICKARIESEDISVSTPGLIETNWYQSAEIVVEGAVVGKISVYYVEKITEDEVPAFLPEERQLLNTIARQVGQNIFNRRLIDTIQYLSGSDEKESQSKNLLHAKSEEEWKWRMDMVTNLAERTNFRYFRIEAMYVIGSVKEATAGPKSDIDLLVHFDGDQKSKEKMEAYIEGWSQCLARLNFEKTGVEMQEGLIDLHVITTEDIENQENSFAAMIGSHSNSARLLKKNRE